MDRLWSRREGGWNTKRGDHRRKHIRAAKDWKFCHPAGQRPKQKTSSTLICHIKSKIKHVQLCGCNLTECGKGYDDFHKALGSGPLKLTSPSSATFPFPEAFTSHLSSGCCVSSAWLSVLHKEVTFTTSQIVFSA